MYYLHDTEMLLNGKDVRTLECILSGHHDQVRLYADGDNFIMPRWGSGMGNEGYWDEHSEFDILMTGILEDGQLTIKFGNDGYVHYGNYKLMAEALTLLKDKLPKHDNALLSTDYTHCGARFGSKPLENKSPFAEIQHLTTSSDGVLNLIKVPDAHTYDIAVTHTVGDCVNVIVSGTICFDGIRHGFFGDGTLVNPNLDFLISVLEEMGKYEDE